GPLLLGRYRRLAETFFAEDRKLAVRRGVWGWALSLGSTVMFYGCYGVIVAATVRGRLTLGDMTLYLVAFRQGQQSFQAILAAAGSMYEDTLYMTNLFEFLAIPTEEDDGAATTAAAPAAAANGPTAAPVATNGTATELGIRFEGVGFRYPKAGDGDGNGGKGN